MPATREARPQQLRFILSALLFGLGTEAGAFDSATAACRQNPALCAQVLGKEGAVLPVKGAAEVVSVAATLRVLTADKKAAIEQALVECAQWASAEVNRLRLGGQSPSREKCQEVLPGVDPCGRTITWGMQLGSEKHALAFQCARERLGALVPSHFVLEQRYRYDMRTGQRQLVSAEEARALLQKGCGEELVGTIVPDVVIHSGNPLEILAVYDFKFPCPQSNASRWTAYEPGHPSGLLNQGELYERALGVTPHRVAPFWGID